ncbi:hypothetical protein Q9R46_18965 [Paenibacillus sp. RRE4]|nr:MULTISPECIES: hypothetical protein [Paenibacillus]MDT0124752.1 hypothetical protein [Paenibacillus sp. RRE4]
MTSCCASFKQINPNDWESASKEFVKDNPAKRLGESKEVGRLVAFLLSGEQSAKS